MPELSFQSLQFWADVMENNEQWKERMQYKSMENDFEWLNLYTL